MTETTPTPPALPKFDITDLMFIAGLLLLGVGLAFCVSWPVALAVCGAVLVAVALMINFMPLRSK